MEVKNSVNKLDQYYNRLDTDKIGTGRPQAGASGESNAARTGDTVNISSPALKSAVIDAANNAPDIRQERVDAIKARIAGGTYETDSKAIAQGMVDAGREIY